MQAHTKKLPTDRVQITFSDGKCPRTYIVSEMEAELIAAILRKHRREPEPEEPVSVNEAFSDLYKKYGKGGAALKGFRLREELTQKQLAAELGIEQSHVSAMESGDRSIGKKTAEKLAKFFKTDYRSFL